MKCSLPNGIKKGGDAIVNTPVSVKEKKEFIKWFLNHYHMKKREAVWILNYLVNYPKLLANVHFVQETKNCPRSITMSAECSQEPAFRFQKNKLITTDAEKAFHDIRLNRNEDLYIQLHFRNANQSIEYRKVLEENPFLSIDDFITDTDKQAAQALLDYSLYQFKRKKIMRKIDIALDQMDQEKFIELSEELSQLEKRKPYQPKLQKQ